MTDLLIDIRTTSRRCAPTAVDPSPLKGEKEEGNMIAKPSPNVQLSMRTVRHAPAVGAGGSVMTKGSECMTPSHEKKARAENEPPHGGESDASTRAVARVRKKEKNKIKSIYRIGRNKNEKSS